MSVSRWHKRWTTFSVNLMVFALLGGLLHSALIAADKADPGKKAAPPKAAPVKAAPGKLLKLSVAPEKLALVGARNTQGLRITGEFADGSLRDITNACKFAVADGKIATVTDKGVVVPKADGSTTVTATYQNAKVTAPLSISKLADKSYNFANDILPVITYLNCNQMGCHGSPKGKKRLHFSLYSADPHKDYLEITDRKKKLISPMGKEESLFLQKAICEVDHGGGDRTEPDSVDYKILDDWISTGAEEGGKDDPQMVSIEVFPKERTWKPGDKLQLLVQALYSDGTTRDVTRLASYSSSEEAVVKVEDAGHAQAGGYGEVVVMVGYGGKLTTSRLTSAQPINIAFPQLAANNKIDEFVYNKLKLLNVPPSGLCSDEVFLRRVYLDVLGILPTADEARAFLGDSNKDKRKVLIDTLLDRPEYADFYAVKWGDILQINRDQPARLQTKGMWTFYRWLWDSLDQNKPMDEFVHELLTAQGSGYRNGPANFFRIGDGAQGMAEHVSTVFLGVRLDCAHCHNHPFERFTLVDNLGMAAFFTRVKLKSSQESEQDREVVYLADSGSIKNPDTNKPALAKFLVGEPIEEAKLPSDPREMLADWIASAENPYFAKHMSNRVWTWLLGRGIVNEPDDFRSTNPPSNPELLDYLASEFVKSGYDLKAMYRLILNSRTYQLSSIPNQWNKDDKVHYSYYQLKRLSAEQLSEAICQVSGVPEKYSGLPLGTRATQLPDISMRSEFLDVFGRPKRSTPVESERTCVTHIGQSLQMISAEFVASKLRSGNGVAARMAASGRPVAEVIDELYLSALSRLPTEAEKKVLLAQPISDKQRREKFEDMLWVLMNTKEFLYNH